MHLPCLSQIDTFPSVEIYADPDLEKITAQ